VPLVSSGPFVLSSRDETEMVLDANPNWRGARGNLSQITFRFRERTDDFEALWRDGGIDVLPAAQSTLADIGEGCIEAAPVLGATIVGFRTDRPAVSDLRVRRAIAAAVAEVAADAESVAASSRRRCRATTTRSPHRPRSTRPRRYWRRPATRAARGSRRSR
jgi:ABC-type transport system substrate-binding protein